MINTLAGITRIDIWVTVAIALCIILIWKTETLIKAGAISVQAVQELANVVNTKGGNILVLMGLTLIFFFTGIGLIFWSLNRMLEDKLTADNAVLMMGLSWVLGTAFGGSFSSMLKVMSGEPAPGTTTTSSIRSNATANGDSTIPITTTKLESTTSVENAPVTLKPEVPNA